MEHLKEFFLTLPSWTSDKLFPDNTAGDYYVKIPKPLQLHGDWKVGMVNVVLPKCWYNVDSSDNFVIIVKIDEPSPIEVSIPYGWYDNVNDLINELNVSISKNLGDNEVFFGYDGRRKKVYVSFGTSDLSLDICKGLCDMMGFTFGDVITRSQYAQGQSNMEANKEFVIVNCDVVDQQTVGNLKSPMLGYMYTKGVNYGESLEYSVDTQYLTLRNKSFEVIHIWVTDLKGNKVHFLPTRSLVQLHFFR